MGKQTNKLSSIKIQNLLFLFLCTYIRLSNNQNNIIKLLNLCCLKNIYIHVIIPIGNLIILHYKNYITIINIILKIINK